MPLRKVARMVHKSGWWQLMTTVTPDEIDLEHIAQLIRQGFTEGPILQNEDEDEENDADDDGMDCPTCGSRINKYEQYCPNCNQLL